MNDLHRGVLTLVKSAITGEAALLPEGFSIEAAEILIMKHQISGMVYEGAVLCGISKKEPAMQRLFQTYYQQIIRSEKQMTALNKLFTVFEENGIDYLPVKGSNMKLMYPDPAMRIMGDADILIRMEQYEKISEIVRELGYTEGEVADHALVWESNALELELHRRLVPTTDADYYRYFGEGWQYAQRVEGNRYTLPNEIMFVFLLTHFAKHYREAGIGLRQTIDLWIYMKKTPMDQEVLLQELSKLDMVEFYQNICKLLESWFEGWHMDEKTEFISDYLFSSGSWGTVQNKRVSQGLRNSKKQGSVKKAKFKMVIDAIFPPLKVMQSRYSVLKKCPWLMPIYWPIRWVGALLFRRGNIKNYAQGVKAVSDDGVNTFEESLEYVGLKMDMYKRIKK